MSEIKTTANIGEFYKEVVKCKSELNIKDFGNIVSTKWVSVESEIAFLKNVKKYAHYGDTNAVWQLLKERIKQLEGEE